MRSRTARVMTTLMRNGRDRRSENPSGPTRYLSAGDCPGPISGSHQGQRPLRPHRNGASLDAKIGRIHGCTRTLRRKVRFLLQRGHRPYMAHSAGSINSDRSARMRASVPSLIRASEPAIASHIRRQDRREFPGFSHDVLPPQAQTSTKSRSELARLDRNSGPPLPHERCPLLAHLCRADRLRSCPLLGV